MDYRTVADAVAAEIAAGRLRPGDRLPPQRRFARRHGIAASTAARVYGELIRRGLAVGEVGRGTFVRAGEPGPEPALAEPGGARIDLELNFPILADQPALLARALERLVRPDALRTSLRPVGAAGTLQCREAAARHLGRAGWQPGPEQILFAGSGRQAIAATIAALVPAGERLGVERLTYPVVKGIAARLGVRLVPLDMDDDGVSPVALSAGPPLHAVYLQPALHNPLGVTMPERRRADLAEVARRRDMWIIEDAIYGFLRDDLPPLSVLAPERTVVVDSLSKRLAPGLTIGFIVPPPQAADRIAATLRSGTWMAARFALDAAVEWLTDGSAAQIERGKRRDAAARQQVAADRLAGFAIRADPQAYHLWWELPEWWRTETFVAAAARRGIAVSPGAAFAVERSGVPNAVRLALGSPPLGILGQALDTLAGLARVTPEDSAVE